MLYMAQAAYTELKLNMGISVLMSLKNDNFRAPFGVSMFREQGI